MPAPRPRAGWPLALALLLLIGVGPASATTAAGANANAAMAVADLAVPDLSPSVLRLAAGAARCAITRGRAPLANTLTIIDYSLPSTTPRLWVIDLATRTVLHREWVAHGSGSGDNLASRFSNAPDSHQSSLGLFVTDGAYVGQNGYSLRLDGLEPGVNDRARQRAIVIHGAPYVDPARSLVQGRLGRSWGCPALRPGVARTVIDRIKGGGLVFAYYPDAEWLAHSPFLASCG